ncbi:IclR family transcriptional regulator [Pseudomonas sp. NA-150]|uniref:IclR family transcriptional regulator n=1 Tax=Pseudomonas sp. NA-150 TaxID=3367525 RepID=UPI0037C70820
MISTEEYSDAQKIRRVPNLPPNRSVERALSILRAFRPGVAALGNAELVELTGLPRSTISRLTQTLVENGFLQYELRRGTYRLGPPLLSLAHALRLESEILKLAQPLMREIAEGHKINVGLAVADQMDMVYLESVRKNRSGLFRHVTSGSRVPMEITSLGHAFLSTLSGPALDTQLNHLKIRHPKNWKQVKASIMNAHKAVHSQGVCQASWQAGITSIASPLGLEDQPPYVFNISFASQDFSASQIESQLIPLLQGLLQKVREQLADARSLEELS